MAWKFLNIGKANSEIERLNAELAKKDKELADAKTAAAAPPPATAPAAAPAAADPDNDGDDHMDCETCNGSGTCSECMGNGKCAECGGEGEVEAKNAEARAPKGKAAKLAVQLDEMAGQLNARDKTIASLQSQISAKDAEIAKLNARIENPAEEVKVKVAQQLVNTQAALGQPAAPAIPATATATNGAGQANGEPKGIARMRNAIKTELDKNFPQPTRN